MTSEGVILVDPIRAEAADWLKGHISQRFGQTVKTIIYSHHHGDHAAGAEAYVDTVEEIIAHENVPAGIIEDDLISVMPTRTFSSHLTVELGNKTVELTEVGPGHSDDLVAVGFPDERVSAHRRYLQRQAAALQWKGWGPRIGDCRYGRGHLATHREHCDGFRHLGYLVTLVLRRQSPSPT